MNIFKIIILPVSLALSTIGCAGVKTSYMMATTSFNYSPHYSDYMLKVNGEEIGGGFGKAISTNKIHVGKQEIVWGETNSENIHFSKNEIFLNKAELRNKKYLAAHIYPDDTVEIITSNNLPVPTEKGLKWLNKLKNNN
ncbi:MULTISPECIES: hypothetical protein [unclassified Acinetobacter]|uniref:hypothetical protein n=1 Tax=unclassified Acinetobacter TaxID=196816 RepID=UPI0015D14952|nr:hypothetical protein [Acinetobacter sp. YH12068_T]UUS65329.1 hypothetical protein MST18_00715 [Acinetobacter sp. YH12068_T]